MQGEKKYHKLDHGGPDHKPQYSVGNLLKIQWTLVTTTAFVPKDVAIKMNLLLYRILNEQIDM